ncbi:MAG: DUF1579 family protein [Phycisphaerales bacterium]|nr:MAG: DUF1579 family protein [Phycisphaerales bacterium]
MKRYTLLGGLVCGTVLMVLTGQAKAQTASGASDDEIRSAIQQAGKLSEFHKQLRPVRGNYKQTIRWWRAPDTEPGEFETRGAAEWILERRFLRLTLHGRWLDLTFEGKLFLGYDNGREECTAVWFDSLGTRTFYVSGKPNEAGTEITFKGEYVDAVSGQPVKVRAKMDMPNKKGETKLNMYRTGPDGNEYKFFEISSERFVARGA